MSYNPKPTRVWSRVQNQCTFATDNVYEDKQLYKGNVLQYKGNSARLTKAQKYSQLSNCTGPNRTKVFATQTQSYTNPNTRGMIRNQFQTYSYPNEIVGAPNNVSGPFEYNIPNPDGCSSTDVLDGGTLACGTYIHPCTGEIYKRPNNDPVICNAASASNVPGQSILCWDKNIQSWFPKPRYVMNNSTDKWPVNYKFLVSAIPPADVTKCLTTALN